MLHKASAEAGFLIHAKMRNIATLPEGQQKVNNANATLQPSEPTREWYNFITDRVHILCVPESVALKIKKK